MRSNQPVDQQQKTFVQHLGVAACVPILVAGCSWTGMMSVTHDGSPSNANASAPAVSEDGRYVVYSSSANNVVTGDTNGVNDVFLRDTQLNLTTRVNLDSLGNQATGGFSAEFAISEDGQYVAFASRATNLAPGASGAHYQLYLRDRVAGTTTLISVDGLGNEGNHDSGSPAVSADGSYVTFDTRASNLSPNDTNGAADVLIYEHSSGALTRVSDDGAGNPGNASSNSPAISADGQRVVFNSTATNLITPNVSAFASDVFVYDFNTSTMSLASVDPSNVLGGSVIGPAQISSNGQYVVYQTKFTEFGPFGLIDFYDAVLHDIDSASTSLVAIPGFTHSGASNPFVSTTGRYIGFHSATPLVSGDMDNLSDVFVYDTVTGVNHYVSTTSDGAHTGGSSQDGSLSADGRYVAYISSATDIVPNDTNGFSDVFLKAVLEPTVTGVIPNMLPIGVTTSVTITGSYFLDGIDVAIQDVTLSNITIVDENTITADATVAPTLTAGARNAVALLYGTGPGDGRGNSASCIACVTFF